MSEQKEPEFLTGMEIEAAVSHSRSTSMDAQITDNMCEDFECGEPFQCFQPHECPAYLAS